MTVTTVWEWMGVCGFLFIGLMCYAAIEQQTIDAEKAKEENNADD